MSTVQRVRFGQETWTKGTRGLEAAHATERPVIENLRMYADGLLGPRPLWEDPTCTIPTTVGDQAVVVPAQLDYVGTTYEGFLTDDFTTVRFYDRSGVLLASAAPAGRDSFPTTTPTIFRVAEHRWLIGDVLLNISFPLQVGAIVVPGVDGVLPMGATTVDPLIQSTFGASQSWGTRGSTIHQGRAFYWGDGVGSGFVPLPRNRVYYSNSIITDGYTGYVTFGSASQFFDVDGEVRGCVSVGPNLMIWTSEGRWFIMQGSGDPAAATFNYLGKGKIPANGRWPQVIDNYGVFLSSDGMSLATINAGGVIDDRSLAYLGFDTTAIDYADDGPTTLAVSSLHNSTLLPYLANTARHNWQGVWTEEVWDLDTYGSDEFQVHIDELYGRETLVVRNPSSGPAWVVHERPITNDRPSRTTAGDFSEYVESYANAPGRLVLPRLFDPTKQTRVKRVVIDAVTWGSNGTDYPAASLAVKVSDGRSNTTTLSLGPASTPLSSVPNSGRTPIRIVATGNPPGHTHFSEVSIENIVGVGIEAVTVEFEISEASVL